MPPSPFLVRRIRADEWTQGRDLRLRSLQDPAADIAFLDTYENAAAQTDAFWRARISRAAEGSEIAQFVAIAGDGEWFGTTTVLATVLEGEPGTALVVGVFVAEGHRGNGAIDALLDACAAWVSGLGITELTLEVHVDNARAQAAYERNGFVRTGRIIELDTGREYVMIRSLDPHAR
ncbi:GNAT family N-acetyltransferase [Microbacterium capsulatum]|uniref:GNAT family N-acetyltransferase n=1 Tax=Microbacterium capsulatum TaxID=3041921 RepID=A0ABU0XCD1_9MICO|nr:GNAT family N-acetyltransferase [Microbacterium sp. ASV81]MDQ4212774.1 GNAT family N-acetyltransferase [Microbacterium sp. ASV81]